MKIYLSNVFLKRHYVSKKQKTSTIQLTSMKRRQIVILQKRIARKICITDALPLKAGNASYILARKHQKNVENKL